MTVEKIKSTRYKCTCEHTDGKNPCGKSWEANDVSERCRFCKRPHWNGRDSYANRKNKPIAFNGKSQPLVAWAKELGVNSATLRDRLRRGWPLEDVLVKGLYQAGRKPKEDKDW